VRRVPAARLRGRVVHCRGQNFLPPEVPQVRRVPEEPHARPAEDPREGDLLHEVL